MVGEHQARQTVISRWTSHVDVDGPKVDQLSRFKGSNLVRFLTLGACARVTIGVLSE